ncbi:hypothetical protein Dimus_001863 [Dionaea muscipula]
MEEGSWSYVMKVHAREEGTPLPLDQDAAAHHVESLARWRDCVSSLASSSCRHAAARHMELLHCAAARRSSSLAILSRRRILVRGGNMLARVIVCRQDAVARMASSLANSHG